MTREEILEKAYSRMTELYGNKDTRYWNHSPSVRILNRFYYEKQFLEGNKLYLRYLELVGRMRTTARKMGEHLVVKGTAATSFIGYLLGATDINPLKIHEYCPQCKFVAFTKEQVSPFDKIHKKCNCGGDIIVDGHDIFFDAKSSSLSCSQIEISVSGGFMKEAQKVSFEVIDIDNVDDIFLQSIGLPREMVGRDYAARAEVINKNETKLRTYVLTKNIEIDEPAQDFSLRKIGMNNFAEAMQNMEIVGDLVPRLIKSAPNDRKIRYIKSINNFQYLGKSEYPEDNNIIVHKYSVTFTGTMDALRNVIRDLNSAILDNRVYVLRNLKLNAPEKDSETALVLGITKAEVLKDDKGNVIEIKMKKEDHLPYNQRRDYGKTLIGNLIIGMIDGLRLTIRKFYIDFSIPPSL